MTWYTYYMNYVLSLQWGRTPYHYAYMFNNKSAISSLTIAKTVKYKCEIVSNIRNIDAAILPAHLTHIKLQYNLKSYTMLSYVHV